MSDWEVTTLGEVCQKVMTGGTPLSSNEDFYRDGTIPWLKTKEVNFCRIRKTENHISELGLANSATKVIPPNSVIIAMYGQGDTAGRVAINEIPLTTNQACCNLVIDENIADYNFVYFYLKNSYRELVNAKTGSAQPNLNTQIIKEFPITIPPLQEQKEISAVLVSLDRKIENLRRQNETLERIAQTLFKHWFVDFEFPNEDGKPYKSSGGEMVRSELGEIPAGWQIRKFRELGELNRGKSKHRPRYAEHLYGGKYPFIQTGDIKESQGFITEYQQTYSEAGLAQSRLWYEETLCITIAANIAETGILSFPSCFPDSVIGFVADSSICDVYFIHRMFKNKRQEIENEAIGSVQKNLNLETIARIKFVVPDLKAHKDSVLLFRNFGERIIANKQQIQTLTKTRDVLIPKLMSGKLRITE